MERQAILDALIDLRGAITLWQGDVECGVMPYADRFPRALATLDAALAMVRAGSSAKAA